MSSGVVVAAGVGAVALYLYSQAEKQLKTGNLKGYTGSLPGANQSGYISNPIVDDNPTCPPGQDLNPNDGLCYPPFNPCGEFPGTILNAEGTLCIPPGGNPNTGVSEDSMDAICVKEFGEGFTYNAADNLCMPPPGGNPCAGMGLGGQDLEYWPESEGGDGLCHYPDGKEPECPNGYVWRKDDRGEERCMRGHKLDIGLSSLPLYAQILAETGLSYAAYMALDTAGRQAARAARAATTSATNAANRAAVNYAGRQAAAAAGGATTAAGRQAGNAAMAARQAAQQSARNAVQAAQAARAAAAAARTTRFGLMMARMSSTPFGLIFMIIAQILIAVLGLNPDEFELCRDGEFDLSSLPDWARILIESIPYAGDLFAMISPTICLRTGCDPPNIEQHGLCYPPPRDNFWCEAFLCYSQHPAWQNNGQLHTTTHITKNIPMDTGTIPLSCPEGSRLDGLLCYRVPEWGNGNGNPGVNIVAGVAWENCRPGMTDTGVRCEDVYGGGVGQLRVVPAGWIDDGLTAREPIRGYPCPGGWIEEPLTCREPLSGGNCHPIHTSCPGGGPWYNIANCRTTGGNCEPIRGGRVEGRRMGGGRVEGRGAGSSLPCPANTHPGGDGLCYENCREGFRREGLLCSRSYDKRSEVLAPFSPSCPADRIDGGPWGSAGLCYMANLPEGYRRVVAGTIEQMCPTSPPEWGPVLENVLDIGVACQRARYDRGAGTIPFNIRVKARRNPMAAPPLPPSCDERRALFKSLDEKGQETHEPVLCMEAPCAEDEDITGDGLVCVPRCRPGYRSMNRGEEVYCVRDATADAPADEYRQRPNREIDFGFE
jgi:hypothetical protein